MSRGVQILTSIFRAMGMTTLAMNGVAKNTANRKTIFELAVFSNTNKMMMEELL